MWQRDIVPIALHPGFFEAGSLAESAGANRLGYNDCSAGPRHSPFAMSPALGTLVYCHVLFLKTVGAGGDPHLGPHVCTAVA